MTFATGARLVFTHGAVRTPFPTAFSASSPAAIITEGFEVLVQLVIAAMTTDPCRSWQSSPLIVRATCVGRAGAAATAVPPPSLSQRPTGAGGAIGEGGLTSVPSPAMKFPRISA